MRAAGPDNVDTGDAKASVHALVAVLNKEIAPVLKAMDTGTR